MNYRELGYVRVAAVAPKVTIADPAANARAMIDALATLAPARPQVVLFPELAITGYACEDLFATRTLLDGAAAALSELTRHTEDTVVIVGLPWQLTDGRLLNCAAVIANGKLAGLVPKTAHPNYGEFYDQRWFATGAGINRQAHHDSLGAFPIATDQLFDCGDFLFGVEVCEDLWTPEPPSVRHCLAGADVIFNLSASNELVAKADYRRELVTSTSARAICGYVYASAAATESTKDVVFGGHMLVAEDGAIIAESDRFALETTTLIAELDVDKLRHDRAQNTTFAGAARPEGYTSVEVSVKQLPVGELHRQYPKHPFVPTDETVFNARAREILDIQSTGLARRVLASGADNLVIGVSGGLDSTLAFLVCLETLAKLDRDTSALHALTMPGPGTTAKTRRAALELGAATGVAVTEVPIDKAVAGHLEDLSHEARDDVVFENAQARERTQILFNYANKHSGIVVGTGDLSELALGWCTFNADQMSNYNVNASVPKTMIAYLVRWYANHKADLALASVLGGVLATPISPELLPVEGEEITQRTEDIIGPFELHDFFLYHYARNGFTPVKIFHLACVAFSKYAPSEVQKWLRLFFTRFFSQQFKRTTLPPGPKVGSVSLSPRGDWRMPDEASAAAMLKEIDTINGKAS